MQRKGVVDGGKGGRKGINLVGGKGKKNCKNQGTRVPQICTFVESSVTCFKINISGCF